MGEYLKPPASSADPYAHMRVDRPTEPWQMEKLKPWETVVETDTGHESVVDTDRQTLASGDFPNDWRDSDTGELDESMRY